MTTRISSPNATTQAIERRILQAGADGTTYNVIMSEMKLGRTCVRNHLAMLEDLDRIYRVKRTQPGRTAIYYTYHANGEKAAPLLSQDDHFNLKAGVVPRRVTLRTWAPINRRDALVEAFFGPAPAQRAA